MIEMDRLDVRHLPVLDEGVLVGVLSDRDLLAETGWLAPRQRELLEAPILEVRALMNAEPQTAGPDEPTSSLATRLGLEHIGCLPVVEDHMLVGIVTETDVLAACRDQLGGGQAPDEEDPLISEVMTADVTCVSPSTSAEDAVAILSERGFRHLPVVEDGRVVGVLSDRDVRKAIGRGEIDLAKVHALMSAEVVCLDASSHLSRAAALLAEFPFSCLPVTREDKLVGVLTVTDLLLAYARRLPQTN